MENEQPQPPNASKAKLRFNLLGFVFPWIAGVLLIIIPYFISPANTPKPAGIPNFALFTVCLAIQMYLLLRKKGADPKAQKKVENPPALFFGLLILLAFPGIVYFVLVNKTYNLLHANVYIDNGTGNTLTIKVNDETYSVENGKWEFIEVPRGQLNVTIADSSRSWQVGSGTWIINPLRKYQYVKRNLVYGSLSISRSGDSRENVRLLSDEEFFSAEADYFFEAPRTIRTKGRSDVEKTEVDHYLKSEYIRQTE